MERGIVLLAAGHAKYGIYAAMAAATIKVANPNEPICLIYTESALGGLLQGHLDLFDYAVELPKKAYSKDAGYMALKVLVYELSPFNTTLFIDADTAILKGRDLEDIYAACSTADLQFQSYGKAKATQRNLAVGRYTMWRPPSETSALFGFDTDMGCISSTVFVAKKSPVCDRIHETAKELAYRTDLPVYKQNPGHIPDEWLFATAMAINGYVQPLEKYAPIYFAAVHGNLTKLALDKARYIGVTPSAHNYAMEVSHYNTAVKSACVKLGVPPYFWVPKRSWQ